MNSYRVRWEIDMEAESPTHAAQQALAIQRNGVDNIATVFDVTNGSITTRVDLTANTARRIDRKPREREHQQQ